jgi:hypothetical protein
MILSTRAKIERKKDYLPPLKNISPNGKPNNKLALVNVTHYG